MKLTVHRSFASILLAGGLAAVIHAGCGSGAGSFGGSTACSSCQESYTIEDCKAWGERAGCTEITLQEPGSCDAQYTGCSFAGCEGQPICDDAGEADCVACKDYTQAECDMLAESAGCSGATLNMYGTCDKMVMGCKFIGCDFRPECP